MDALRLALAFVRVPRLFLTLFFLPILISIVIVYLQLFITGIALRVGDTTSAQGLEQALEKAKSNHLASHLLFGGEGPPEETLVCRWVPVSGTEGITEAPPSPECAPDRLDAAIQVEDVESFDVSSHLEVLSGKVERLHVCRTCSPDIVIKQTPEGVSSHLHSIWAALILSLSNYDDELNESRVQVIAHYDTLRQAYGKLYFYARGFNGPIKVSGAGKRSAVVVNIIALSIIALWLALKAHRKVLDYFARNGALLPMVAATGKTSFYSAIWLLTTFRVGAFLGAAVPISYFGLKSLFTGGSPVVLFRGDLLLLGIWVVTLLSALALASLVTSVAELKHRHQFTSFVYKYIPLILSLFGGVIWLATFIADGVTADMIRRFVTATPVLGMAPVLVAPMFTPHLFILLTHTVLSLVILGLSAKHNARWFAAHLEEL